MPRARSIARDPYPHQRPASRSRAPARKGARDYDVIVVGGGPAGLSAAIYLARFNRRTLVIDAGQGRSTTHETNENYLGFPRGVRSRDLRDRGCRQASRFGAEMHEGRVTSAGRNGRGFDVRAGRHVFHAAALILATGVKDRFPDLTGIERYVGKSLFWCITCDGWKARDKRVVVVGNDDEAATTALQFLNFTDRVTLLTNAGRTEVSAKKRRAVAQAHVPLVEAEIARVRGKRGRMSEIVTTAGERLELDMMFSMQGCEPNVALAEALGVQLDRGFIKTDVEQRTNVARVYAAGDVTKAFAHQVVTAAHEGAQAAQAANYDLYRPDQRA
jgi:thioredoxin reductase (NADPH)